MASSRHYDAIIIGSGQGGGPLSTALVAAGRSTAIIEREYIGGTCINTGCTPTKTMYASGRVAYLAARAADYGVEVGPETVNMAVVRGRKRAVVERFRLGSERSIKNGNVEIVKGEASFTEPKALLVRTSDGETLKLSADLIVIDTGSRPADPPLEGLASVPHFNSTTLMELAEAPEHLLILGGGYIAVEFGQMYRRFGSRVTIVQRAGQLLEQEDPDIAGAIAGIFREDGVEVLLGATAERVEPAPGGLTMTVRCGDGERRIDASHLLVAVGRRPNTEALNLDAAGIRCTERGVIQVDERLQTTADGVYALGEVAGQPAFTHISYDDFRILRANLLEGGDRTTVGRLVPYTVFIDPQLGRVGLGEKQLDGSGVNARVARMPMGHVARAIEMDETRGMVKAIVDRDTDLILGFSALGIEGGELMAMAEIAMMGKVPYTLLRDGIFAHPTLAELFNNLFSSFDGE